MTAPPSSRTAVARASAWRSPEAMPGTRCSSAARRASHAPTATLTRRSRPTHGRGRRSPMTRAAACAPSGRVAWRCVATCTSASGSWQQRAGSAGQGACAFERVVTRHARLSTLEAGIGPPVLAIHGLGGTKGSFLLTVAALAGRFRVVAVDLPGFGDSDKPIGAAYDASFFADAMIDLLDALELDRADLIGNSLGGRVALEVALRDPERVGRLALLAPSLAWRRPRRWAPALRLVRPELGLVQLAPRAVVRGGRAPPHPGRR